MRAHTTFGAYGAWYSYHGAGAVVLAVVLLIVAAGLAFTGTRLRTPISVTRPGRTVSGLLIAIWALSVFTFLVALRVFALQLKSAHPDFYLPKVQVGTFYYALVTFFVIFFLTRKHGSKTALAGAFVGAVAAPMFFELPFDLIILRMTYPAIPPNTALFRALFFLPLFLVELSTISLLTMVPTMRITKYALYALAGMFAVFTIWAALGFAYPSTPLPLALNIISKILCFVAAIMLFSSDRGACSVGVKMREA